MPETQNHPLPSMETRLSKAEALSAQNTDAIVQLTHNIDRISSDMVRGFKEVRADIASSQRTNWVPIGTFLGVFVAIGGLLCTFNGQEIARIEKRGDKAEEAIVEAAYHRGRADEARDTIRADVVGLRSNDSDLDDRLQREMRDVNATTEAKLMGLDKRIQEEITRNASERREQIQQIRENVNTISRFQNEASATHAEHRARIESLERKP